MGTLATTATGALATTREVTLYMPALGSWRAAVALESGTPPAEGSGVTLTVGDLSLVGRVLRSGLDAPDRPRCVVVGGLGWETPTLAPISLQSDAGVRLSTVLAALAEVAGEPFAAPPDAILGEAWGIDAGVPVREALEALQRSGGIVGWYPDAAGVTRFQARTGTEVAVRATVLRADAGQGSTVYGVDNPAAFLPGATVGGVAIGRCVIRETSAEVTVETWAPADPSEAGIGALRRSIVRTVREAFPQLAYGYTRTYVVAALHLDGGGSPDGRLDLVPPPDATGLRELRAVESWTVGGARVLPAVGSRVVVAFRDANPERPTLRGFAPLDGGPDATTPTEVRIDATGPGLVEVGPSAAHVKLAGVGPAVARVGDNSDCGTLAVVPVPLPAPVGTVALVYTGPGVGVPVTLVTFLGSPTVTPSASVSGLINTGSAKATCG